MQCIWLISAFSSYPCTWLDNILWWLVMVFWWFRMILGCFYDDSWWFMMLYPLPLSHYIFTHGFERILKVLFLKLLTSASIRSKIIIIHHLFQLLKSLDIEKPQLVGLWAFCCHSSSFFNTFSNLQWKDYLFANLLHEIYFEKNIFDKILFHKIYFIRCIS